MKAALLIIDAQNDFVLPTGNLPVAGAVEDMDRVVEFIKRKGGSLNRIICTLDSHRPIDISHPSFWAKADGTLVDPFTPITYADIQSGKYTPRSHAAVAIQYVKDLEEQGEFPHFIWPYHCLIGTVGAALYKPLSDAITAWEVENGRLVRFETKGSNPLTEHFGAFRANIPVPNDPSTQFNQTLAKTLMEHDVVYLCGEARSHCVLNSLLQALAEYPELAKKLRIMQDCMSDVPGIPDPAFYVMVNDRYDDVRKQGAQFANAADL